MSAKGKDFLADSHNRFLKRVEQLSTRELVLLTALTTTWVACSVYYIGGEGLVKGVLPPSSAFAGMLALNGFLFTARTFITFKLNETVYSKDSYRDDVRRYQESGDYKKKLYDPLRELDHTVGCASFWCFGVLIVLTVFMLLPRNLWEAGRLHDFWSQSFQRPCLFIIFQIITWLTYSAVLASLVCVLNAILRVNHNIKEIIAFWEEDANRPKNPPV